MVDMDRNTQGVLLPPELSGEIWQETAYTSAVMQLGQRVNLPGPGVQVEIITGDPEAQWVAETDEKPVSRSTLDSKIMKPYKLAVIEPFSNEFRRDKAALYAALRQRLPQALARKFDQTVLGGGTAPGSDFDTLNGAAAVDIASDTYQGLVAADQAVASADGILNGWALSPQARGLLLGQVDNAGRPLFISDVNNEGTVNRLLGQPVSQTKAVYLQGTPNQLGYAGDWTTAHWGTVEGVSVAISDQATINDGGTQLNLWQRNMFAVRAEVEVGFRVRDINRFVKLTDGATAG